MTGRAESGYIVKRKSLLPDLDKRVLLGSLGLIAVTFLIIWIVSRDFLPGARMFPGFIAVAGGIVTLIAIARVWLGMEPAQGPGQVIPPADEDVWPAYRFALVVVMGIVAYYIGVFLIGFMPATGIYLIVFGLRYGHSYKYIGATTCGSLLFVYALDAALDLHLPLGWLARFVG